MKTALRYIGLTVAFAFLSSGVLVASFLDAFPSVGYGMLWLLLPLTMLFIAAVLVNDKVMIPRLLLGGKYVGYALAVYGVVSIVTLLSLGLEYVTRKGLDLPMRISDYSSPWILADILGNGLLLAMILLGLGLLHLFNRWNAEVGKETIMSDRLEEYINAVSHRLNPANILGRLVSATRELSAERMCEKIRELSDYLRVQLYELPEPPKSDAETSWRDEHPRIAELLVGRRWHVWRHAAFAGVLMTISCGAFFIAPDRPEFTAQRAMGVMSMFGLLLLVSYVNIWWLYPRFMKCGNIRRYAVATGALLALLAVPVILMQVLTYESNVYDKGLPVIVAVISAVGSIMTLFMFIGGISAVLVLQNWIRTRRRMALLRAETLRQEYAYLRKQINPHFLFNVLNNIGIAAYDDPKKASSLLDDLNGLLQYQLGDMRRDMTALKDECAFIRSYFALAATRREHFEYSLTADSDAADVRMPTLLFIPFIENAVKYSLSREDAPDVEVAFRHDGRSLTFECCNGIDKMKAARSKPGGIGISNTLRRLDYLYEGNYHYECLRTDGAYIVKLTIPLIRL